MRPKHQAVKAGIREQRREHAGTVGRSAQNTAGPTAAMLTLTWCGLTLPYLL